MQAKTTFKFLVRQAVATQCLVCRQGFERGHALNIERASMLYSRTNILCHAWYDRLCTPCHRVNKDALVELLLRNIQLKLIPGAESLNILSEFINRDRMIQSLCLLINNDHFAECVNFHHQHQATVQQSNAWFAYDNIDDDTCNTLTAHSKQTIDEVSIRIIHQVEQFADNDIIQKPLNVLLREIDDQSKLNETRIIQVAIDHSVDLQPLPPIADRNITHLPKIRQCLYIFLVKTVANDSATRLAIYHQCDESTIRRLFHRGRMLMFTFFAPWYFGSLSLSREAALAKQSRYWCHVFNEVTGLNLVGFFDSTKFRQSSSWVFGHAYNTYDVSKHYVARGYLAMCTTSGYWVHFFGPNCTNGRHGDSHLMNYYSIRNSAELRRLFDVKTNAFFNDRGFQYLLGYTPWHMFMPTLCRLAMIPTFLANCSRIGTAIRWIEEAGFGHIKHKYGIFAKTIHPQHKKYYHSWLCNILALENYIHPRGWVNGRTEEPTACRQWNWMKYKIKSEMFSNRLKPTVDELNRLHEEAAEMPIDQASRQQWLPVNIDTIRALVPGMGRLEEFCRLSDADLELFGGGSYAWKLCSKYIEHNIVRNDESETHDLSLQFWLSSHQV